MLFVEYAKLAGMVYKYLDDWEHVGVVSTYDVGDTQAVLCLDGKRIKVIFRGTESLGDFAADANFIKTITPYGNIHTGFLNALRLVYDDIIHDIEALEEDLPIDVIGHSLGGGLANIFAMKLCQANYIGVSLYTYGCPRVGDVQFCDTLDAFMYDRHFRFVNNNDVVARVPPRIFGFSHAGQVKYITHDGKVTGRKEWLARLIDRLQGRWDDLFLLGTDGIKDHSIDNYIELLENFYD